MGTFTLNYYVTGSERKRLAQTIAEITECETKYKGAPTFAYELDYFTIDKNGTVSFDDRADSEEIENLIERLLEKGFKAAPALEDLQMDGREELGLGRNQREDFQGENGMQASDIPEPYQDIGLVIEIPRSSFTDTALENLKRLVESKGRLIKKALGAEMLELEITDDKVQFPWFEDGTDPDAVKAYTHFVAALCEMSRVQKRVTAKEKETDNDKYTFRCFLLRLGFIGAEYKDERKILLKNLTGSSAFKTPKSEVSDDEQ
ncbi:MAG: virulence protein [Candidatus Pararuminococcus gallinarum]|jgi:hypothetical protein